MNQEYQTRPGTLAGGTVILSAVCAVLVFAGAQMVAAREAREPTEADRMLASYFQSETKKLQDGCLTDIKTLADWQARRGEYRRELREMLGLDPLPERTPLEATVTGTVEHEQFTVENLHYQSMPGLYVTANLYVPKGLDKPAPAVLYVCGHASVKKDGVSYGNKVAYQHHAIWFARHGYVCLVLDTLQLGEIEGIHHGTYRYKMWWWNSRGYTPAGVEAWNCIRALDYLDTRKEVDASRIGVTGRSGGGAYSWWIAALDDRVKAAVPVAGITDLQNHVVDGCVEGHCDCMFIVNTYRWDYPLVAALVAPRPLLISNSDKDTIFPLDGVLRVHEKVRRIYRLYGAEDKLGLHITEGPHKDTQELRVHAFTWFNRHLKGESSLIDEPAVRLFESEQLRVFHELPPDQLNAKIQETFVPAGSAPSVPQSSQEWAAMRDGWMQALREKVFRGWPTEREAGPLNVEQVFSAEADGVCLTAFDFTSQPYVRLRFFRVEGILPSNRGQDARDTGRATLTVLDEAGWMKWLAVMRSKFGESLDGYALPDADPSAFAALREAVTTEKRVLAYVCPRGIGPNAWSGDERKQTHIRRRFMLLGQTRDGMRVWDVRRAMQALRQVRDTAGGSVVVNACDDMAAIALHAALFEPGIASLELTNLPQNHQDGPVFLNVSRYFDVSQAVTMAAERMDVVLRGQDAPAWQFPRMVAENLHWDRNRFRLDAGLETQSSQ